MKTLSITPATSASEQARLRGLALVSVIIALMLSLLLEALDQTIVGTAMSRIIAELHGLDRYTWVVTAYVLASMTMDQLILFRALQGLGAGMGMALVATFFGDLFEPAARARWGSVFGIVYGVSNL